MGHAILRVLAFFLLNILVYFGHAQDLMLTIEPNWSTLFTGESVTLICDMREGQETDWYYTILKDGREFFPNNTNKKFTLQSQATGHSGEYQCFGRHKVSTYVTRQSNKVSLTVSDSDVILERPASTLYEGESVTLRCRQRTPRGEKTASFYKDGSLIEMDTNHQSPISSKNTVKMTIQPGSDESSYMCKFDEDEESQPIKLKVESQRPKAKLKKDFPAGGNVTLTCSVNTPSSDWKYFWYRGEKTSEPLTTQDAVFLSNEKVRVSQGGVYWCRGGRGEPVYYTEYSDPVVTHKAVVTLQPNWPETYYRETITLICEIENGGDTEWEYLWALPGSHTSLKQDKYIIRDAQSSHTGDYRCTGRLKSGTSSTDWSDAFRLTLTDNPQPVLTVSPSWLSPGASVTLNCEVKHPSAGWRFYWYKAVPKSENYYSFKLLPESTSGTEQNSYIVHGQTHTAGYMCRAGRGDPIYYTYYSKPTFVWSGDFQPSASLTVSPDRVQHLTSDFVSLRCEGDSTQWRVMRFSKLGYLSRCSSWGTMTGSTCNTHKSQYTDGVYWCESETGQFSNAVNITGQYKNRIIMVSPVHPVTEGDSVTLGCWLKTEKNVNLSYVGFYKNGKLIQNDTRWELTIPAVTKSDEGFYKCEGRDSLQSWQRRTSPQSWMSVKSVSEPQSQATSPHPVMWIVGLVCGVLLIILLLLLLCCCTKSKGSCFIRSQSTNQVSATDHMINQDETQGREYASLLHGDVALYETIEGHEGAGHGTNKGPEECADYENVRMGSAADQ